MDKIKCISIKFLKMIIRLMSWLTCTIGIVSIILFYFGYRPIQVGSAKYDWGAISSISALVTAIVTTLYLIATFMILKENQKTNKLNREQFEDLSQPKIIVDFYVHNGSELRLMIKNEGRTTASNVKIKINYLTEWLSSHDSNTYYYHTCKELQESEFTLVSNKEKYFCIGDIHQMVLENDVKIDVYYSDIKKKNHTTSFTHNISLYKFVNGDNADPITKLNKSVSDLADVIRHAKQ